MMRNNFCVGFVGIRVSTFVLLSAIMVLLLSAIACSSSGTDDPAVGGTDDPSVDTSGYSLSYDNVKGSIGIALDAGPIWDTTPTATYEIAPELPPELGLTFDPETGNITGTPKTGGGGLYTVSAAVSSYSGTLEAKVFITVFIDPIVVSEPKESIAIGTRANLGKIGRDESFPLSGTYHLTADIDLDDPASNAADLWEPIGSESEPFTGTLHGNGHAIYNLKIAGVPEDSDAGNYQGLFAKIDGSTAKVENLGIGISSIKGNAAIGAVAGIVASGSVTNIAAVAMSAPSADAPTLEASGTVDITGAGGSWVGGLVGYLGGTVSGYATGAVAGSGNNVGGLVGANHGTASGYATGAVSGGSNVGGLGGVNLGTMSGYATGAVTGSTFVGGLVGSNNTGAVSGYATGAVSGTSYVGGLAGNVYNSGTASGYATGAVSGGSNVGGLAGQVSGASTASGYATGAVTGSTFVGGLVGYLGGTVIGYWDKASTKQANSVGIGTLSSGEGISATKNIALDSTTYTDSGATDPSAAIFNDATFLTVFALPSTAKTWPKLKASYTFVSKAVSFDFPQPTVSDTDGDGKIEVIVN